MFKRLAKSRRHSADEIGCSLPQGTVTLDGSPGQESPPVKSFEGQIQAFNSALLRVSRNKYTRRSCGDAPSMQSLLVSVDEGSTGLRSGSETDYQTVTAVPAFIVEHEPEKLLQPQRGLGVWGRRMSKKIESFRRAGSRESICSPTERSDHVPRDNNNDYISNNNNNNNTSNNNNNENANNNDRVTGVSPSANNKKMAKDSASAEKSLAVKKSDGKSERKFLSTNHRSPSPFKSFFIRMGSTGMLNSTRSNNRRSENVQQSRISSSDKDNLFRSCSTSHLNASPTYVKGDDPSDGIDLQIGHRRDKTLSCDDLAAHQTDDEVFANDEVVDDTGLSTNTFGPCDLGNSRNATLRKSSSCDLKEPKKCNFPYAFLRSKLSVLPEERQQHGSTKDDRLFKATSEERFPTLTTEESYDGTTTLGRRRISKNSDNGVVYRRDNDSRYCRNSYAEPSETRLMGRNASSCEEDRYSLNPSRLERIENCYQSDERFYDGSYPRSCASALSGSINRSSDSAFNHQRPPRQQREDETANICGSRLSDRRFSETSFLTVDLDVMADIRNHRRNSAPSTEQRLSSHYVSSNESGYDSDGPRGESTIVSENENASLKCANTDSSDTGSVIDAEIEKPPRTSTPSEIIRHVEDSNNLGKADFAIGKQVEEDDIDGLRWHRSNSGRILPSIHHQACYTNDDSAKYGFSGYANDTSQVTSTSASNYFPYMAPHRARLQQDKTRFLSDIILPPKRIRRCRLVQLSKKDSRESLGIRLAQQRIGEPRYIVVQLENGGIAHRDGRLRLGDEIVEVEGRDLKTLDGLAEVQEFLKSFTGNEVRLVTAYEETLPQVLNDMTTDDRRESHENGAGAIPIESSESRKSSIDDRTSSKLGDTVQLRKRPDNLPVSSCLRNKNRREAVIETPIESQQYLTRHVAKFEKGYGKPSLGFSVVGGRDSPRGEMGIFVRRVFPGGQADVSKSLFQGDEILSLNGKILRGHTHQEVIEFFKAVREGPVELDLARRHRFPKTPVQSATY